MIILIKDIPQNTETSKLTYSILYLMAVFVCLFVCLFFFNRFNDIPGVFFFFYIVAIVHVQMQFRNAPTYISTVTL